LQFNGLISHYLASKLALLNKPKLAQAPKHSSFYCSINRLGQMPPTTAFSVNQTVKPPHCRSHASPSLITRFFDFPAAFLVMFIRQVVKSIERLIPRSCQI